MKTTAKNKFNLEPTIKRQKEMLYENVAKGHWTAICRDKFGNIKWEEEWDNIVVTEGLNTYLDYTLKTGQASPVWYVGLIGTTPTVAAADTMSSHTGWSEVTAYDETDRQTWTPGTVSAASVSNAASPAVFTCSTNSTTVGGAFVTSGQTPGGTTGILFAAGAFSTGDKSLDDGDTISITATFSQTSS